MSGCGRENKKPCGYLAGSLTAVIEQPVGANAAFAAMNTAFAAESSIGRSWPATLSVTASCAPAPLNDSENDVPATAMFDTTTSASLAAVPGVPPVAEA